MRAVRKVVSGRKTSRIPGGLGLMEPGIFLSRHHGEDRLAVRVHWNDLAGVGQRKWFHAGRISGKSSNNAKLAYESARRFREQYLLFRAKGRLAWFNPNHAPYSNRVMAILLGEVVNVGLD